MQEHTTVGGYNLIVCAMDTEDYPCSVNFPFTFKEGELADYYKDWELIKYNENPGHLHRRDENGNRIQLRFATMLAKKNQNNTLRKSLQTTSASLYRTQVQLAASFLVCFLIFIEYKHE